MHKIEEVEHARSLMQQGREWPVWRWLFEKGRVRAAADRATEALAAANQKVKDSWSDDLKRAYSNGKGKAEVKEAVGRVREADEEATRTTDEAETMFAEAERSMNGGMARQAAQKALDSYDLREAAIRKAEAARRAVAAKASGR